MYFYIEWFRRCKRVLYMLSQSGSRFFIEIEILDQFFIDLFKRQNVFRPRKCLRCDGFLLNHRFKVNHDFLLDYGEGRDAFKEIPLNYMRLGKIKKYEITFAQDSQDYDFYNSEKLVDHFLLNVKSRIRLSPEGDFIIQFGFSLENVQPSPFENEAPIVNSRYWSTKAYQTKSFND